MNDIEIDQFKTSEHGREVFSRSDICITECPLLLPVATGW